MPRHIVVCHGIKTWNGNDGVTFTCPFCKRSCSMLRDGQEDAFIINWVRHHLMSHGGYLFHALGLERELNRA